MGNYGNRKCDIVYCFVECKSAEGRTNLQTMSSETSNSKTVRFNVQIMRRK